MRLFDTIWERCSAGDHSSVIQLCELGRSLDFLASSPAFQSDSVPDCPFCEAWSLYVLKVQDVLKSACAAELRVAVPQLTAIWDACNGMSEAATRCSDREIFFHSDWRVVRALAEAAVTQSGWIDFRPHCDDVIDSCRKGLAE